MGGAFTGQADDLSAIQHNPAGLTQLSGVQALLDGRLTNHQVDFQRTNSAGQALFAQQVHNSAGVYMAPFIAAAYGWTVWDRALTVALGVYGPPSVGRYAYPAPNYTLNGAGNFIAVGESGTVLTSPDGATWTEQSTPTSEDLQEVTHANGLFVVELMSGRLVEQICKQARQRACDRDED